MHPDRVRREFAEMWQNVCCEARREPLPRFMDVYFVGKTTIHDVSVARLYGRFRVHDMRQEFHILNLVLSCPNVIPVAGLHGSA